MSRSFNKATNRSDFNGRTLWQIFWKDDSSEDENGQNSVTIVDASNREVNTDLRRSKETRMFGGDLGDGGVEMVGYTPPAGEQDGEVVLFEKDEPGKAAAQTNGAIRNGSKKTFRESDWEAVELKPPGDFRYRKDSDLDLMLPTNHRRQWDARLRWCFVGCHHGTVLRRYWWVGLVAVLVVLLYVIIVYIIINNLGKT